MGEIVDINDLKLQGLLKEYDRFYEIIKERSSDIWLLGSIFIATSLLIFLYAVIYPQNFLSITLLAIASIACFFVWILFYKRASDINDLCFDQLTEIERKIQRITGNMCINVHRYLKHHSIVDRWRSIGKRPFYGLFIVFLALWIFLLINNSCIAPAIILPVVCFFINWAIDTYVHDC